MTLLVTSASAFYPCLVASCSSADPIKVFFKTHLKTNMNKLSKEIDSELDKTALILNRNFVINMLIELYTRPILTPAEKTSSQTE